MTVSRSGWSDRGNSTSGANVIAGGVISFSLGREPVVVGGSAQDGLDCASADETTGVGSGDEFAAVATGSWLVAASRPTLTMGMGAIGAVGAGDNEDTVVTTEVFWVLFDSFPRVGRGGRVATRGGAGATAALVRCTVAEDALAGRGTDVCVGLTSWARAGVA